MQTKAAKGTGRVRYLTIGFRITPEQNAEVNEAVAFSGLTKQDYITRKLTDRTVEVTPNSRVQQALSRSMVRVYRELRRISEASEMSEPLIKSIELLSDVFRQLGEPEALSDIEEETASILDMERS